MFNTCPLSPYNYLLSSFCNFSFSTIPPSKLSPSSSLLERIHLSSPSEEEELEDEEEEYWMLLSKSTKLCFVCLISNSDFLDFKVCFMKKFRSRTDLMMCTMFSSFSILASPILYRVLYFVVMFSFIQQKVLNKEPQQQMSNS